MGFCRGSHRSWEMNGRSWRVRRSWRRRCGGRHSWGKPTMTPDLMRTHRIWWDLAKSGEISSGFGQTSIISSTAPLAPPTDCSLVSDWLVNRINPITRPPKPINRPARSDHLNGWSTGWSFANPSLSGRIKNYPQTRPVRPEPTPSGVKWVGLVGFWWAINELDLSKPIAHLDPFNKVCITHTQPNPPIYPIILCI